MANAIVNELTYSGAVVGGGGPLVFGVNPYSTPGANTDPNSFGTVDRTLDPSMSDTTLQSNIDAAGDGGVIDWAGSTHYQVATDFRFLTGQKHYTNNNRIIKCTNTNNIDSIVNMKAPKGGGPSKTDITISDLEFWGHVNVPTRPTATAARRLIVPWRNAFLRRVKMKGGQETGWACNGDRVQGLNIRFDSCEVSYCCDGPTIAGIKAGHKCTYVGLPGDLPGSNMTLLHTEYHHIWAHGMWWDIQSAGVLALANNIHDNGSAGIFWEEGAGPVYFRDNTVQNNGGGGAIPSTGGESSGFSIISGARGQVINNILGGNSGAGVRMYQDRTSQVGPTRDELTYPQTGGAHSGYQMDGPWDVLGNVLNGDSFTVGSEFPPTPTINYSTTPYSSTIW